MRRPLLALMLAAAGLSGAFATGDYAHITLKNKMQAFHESLALYSPQPAEKSKIDGPADLPVLALYFFREHLTFEEKTTFAAAIAANKHGTGVEYPYAVLELGLYPDPPLRPESVHVFNVGRCLGEKSYPLTGAMLDYPDQRAQWKVDFTTLSGELKGGGTIQYEASFTHIASRYLAEFRGSAPLMVVTRSLSDQP